MATGRAEPLDVRPFVAADAAIVAEWAATSDEVLAWCSRTSAPVSPTVIAGWSTDPAVEAYVLREGSRPIGYGELWIDDAGDEVELAHLIVDPAHRGRGLGRRFVGDLVRVARQHHQQVVLRVRPDNSPARRCYESAGFGRADADDERPWNEGQPVDDLWMVASETSTGHWFEPIADHLGRAYLRYSFTKGTDQEIAFLVEALALEPGTRVLDVGCGPGRHAHALAARGIEVVGIDISERFVELAAEQAPPGATFRRIDARSMPFVAEFDAVICLCQGAFGLMTADGDDEKVVAGMARALRPGGRLAMSAFSAYFVMKHWRDADFDADAGVNHERTEIRDERGNTVETSLWTGCYTPRELRWMCGAHGLVVDSISSVEPGAYTLDRPTADTAEFLVLAHRTPRG